jgi:hypothetical protein
MWGKYMALAPCSRRDSGPPFGLGGVMDKSGVRAPDVRDGAVLR